MLGQHIRNTNIRRLAGPASRLAAWSCIVTVAVLSLAPKEQMVRTELGGHVEHVLAYAGTAFVAAMAYGKRGLARIVLALAVYAGMLEFLQRFSPGRVSSLYDMMFSIAGVLAGAAAFALSKRILAYAGSGN